MFISIRIKIKKLKFENVYIQIETIRELDSKLQIIPYYYTGLFYCKTEILQ